MVVIINTPHPFAVREQVRWACFPYRTWFLQPTGPDTAALTVELANELTIKVEVSAEGCTLVRPRDAALRELHARPLPATLFLRRLLHHGLNLMPCDDDARRLSEAAAAAAAAAAAGVGGMEACLKDHALEVRAAMGTSLMAAAFAVAPSRFNSGLGRQEIAVRFAKSMDYQTTQSE